MKPNKDLGQHWLHDAQILRDIADAADISADDTILEIGPGLGTLTAVLCEKAKNVVAVEFDAELAKNLPSRVDAKNLSVQNADILQFDLSKLPANYKVVANVPYYITSKIVQKLLSANNRPSVAVLLVQREVAERLAAKPGDMSVLSVSAQLFATVDLGVEVPAKFFTPPPKVDSQVVVLRVRKTPLFADLDEKRFFRIVKAGFANRRKKLRSSLAAGLAISKLDAENLLRKVDIDPNLRAQDLSLTDWQKLAQLTANY